MLACLFWLVLKAAPVNKKHRYVLCYVLKEQKLGKKSVLRCWAGRREGGKKIPEKERELGKQMSAVCQDLCVGVKATGRRAAWLRATLTSPRAVPHDLGWVLHHVLFSWWLACCLPLGLCSPLCWLLQYSFSLSSQGFDAYVLKVATVTLGGSRW